MTRKNKVKVFVVIGVVVGFLGGFYIGQKSVPYGGNKPSIVSFYELLKSIQEQLKQLQK